MPRISFLKLFLVLAAVSLLGAGCNRADFNAFVKNNVADKIRDQFKAAQERALNALDDTSRNVIKNLTDAQKKAIDGWLTRNKLNEYGDAKDTVYAGGTPLFNEATGETTNRYEYLFKKFPELKEIVKKAVVDKATEK